MKRNKKNIVLLLFSQHWIIFIPLDTWEKSLEVLYCLKPLTPKCLTCHAAKQAGSSQHFCPPHDGPKQSLPTHSALSSTVWQSYRLCKWLLNIGSGGKDQLSFLYMLFKDIHMLYVLCFLKTQIQLITSN